VTGKRPCPWIVPAILLAAACDDGTGGPMMLPPEGPDAFRPTDFGPAPEAPGADARGEADERGDAFADLKPFSIVVLPDTQFYSRHYEDVFVKQTQWIAEKRDELNIAFVLHLGDIVDYNLPTEWMAASRAMSHLDGKVPYVLNVGNHDIQNGDRFGMINFYFPVSRYAGASWFRGTWEPNDTHNTWALFDVGGQPWLVVSLEFGPRDGALAWADGILKMHPKTPAIIVTHAYLYKDATRYNRKLPKPQPHGPYDYPWLGKFPGGSNDGEEMWDKLVSKNPNVRFVLSGHDVFDAYARLTSTRPDGTRVHQILSNYQFYYACPCPMNLGGNGWLRIMELAPAQRKVRVRTYSPWLQRSWDEPTTADKNEFELDL
jgi:hypothetical protein